MSILEASLVKKKNPKTDKLEYALVSKNDSSKVLEYFGVKKPSAEQVPKSERRIQFFKHKGAILAKLLQNGEKGDWKKEGYEIKYFGNHKDAGKFVDSTPHDFIQLFPSNLANQSVYALKDGEIVGFIQLVKANDGLVAVDTRIKSEHQRKGLASAMYQEAEKVSGLKAKPSDNQTDADKELWKQKNRPFGAAIDDWKKEGFKIKHKYIKHKNLSDHDKNIFGDKLEISAYDTQGNKIGHLGLDPEAVKNKLMPRGVFVEDAHQRKGIASAMYDYAEKLTGKKIVPQKGHQSPESKKFWENRIQRVLDISSKNKDNNLFTSYGCLASFIDILATNLTYQSIFDILGISILLKNRYILTQKLPKKYIDYIMNKINIFLKNPLYKSLSLESEEDLKFLSENIAFKDYLEKIFSELQKKLVQYEHRFLEFFNKYPEKSEISLEELKKSVKLDEISILFILDSLKTRQKIYDYNERKVTLN